MNKILILGSEGFLGKKIYQFLKVKHNIYTLDLLSSERKKHIKKNIKVFKLAKFIKEKKVNFIIDLIGSTNHNFLKKSDLKESYDKNYQHKINIINNLEKIKNEINYFSIGSIYKFGWRRKIKKEIFLPINKSNDPQLIFKHKFESKLYNLKNNNIKIKIINIGSVYGNKNNQKFTRMNLIDQIAFKIQKGQKNTIYISKNTRYKNCLYINNLPKIINPLLKKNKHKYSEINIVNNLVNLNVLSSKLKKYFKTTNIKLTSKKFYYYYINKPKLYKKTFNEFNQIYFK